MSTATDGVILEMHGVKKRYGHVEALGGVDLDLRRGEILGLVGDNGAGKSTLMKILAGAVSHDEGEVVHRRPTRQDRLDRAGP